MNIYLYLPYLLSGRGEIQYRKSACDSMLYFRVSLQSVQKRPYYSYWRQQNYICSCTVKLEDIVKVNKALQMLLYYVTEHIISNLVSLCRRTVCWKHLR